MGRWHSTTSSGPRNQLHPTRCPNLPSEPHAQSGPSTGLIFSKNNGGTGPEPSHPGGEGGVICSVVYYRERTPPTAPSEVRSSFRSNNKIFSKNSIWVERRNFYGAVSLSSREQDLIRKSPLLRPQGGGVVGFSRSSVWDRAANIY